LRITETDKIQEGDTVIVDQGFRNGGYKAKVIDCDENMALIISDNKTWTIMKSRLTKVDG